MKKISLIVLITLGIALGVLMFFDGAYRSMIYMYPVTVEVPNGVNARVVSYECLFRLEHVEPILDDIHSYDSSFETVKGLRFDAQIQGHHNTRWFGLIENKGRESVIVVRVETGDGELYVGVAELPSTAGTVTVKVEELK